MFDARDLIVCQFDKVCIKNLLSFLKFVVALVVVAVAATVVVGSSFSYNCSRKGLLVAS